MGGKLQLKVKKKNGIKINCEPFLARKVGFLILEFRYWDLAVEIFWRYKQLGSLLKWPC